jgi:hypothetical protein
MPKPDNGAVCIARKHLCFAKDLSDWLKSGLYGRRLGPRESVAIQARQTRKIGERQIQPLAHPVRRQVYGFPEIVDQRRQDWLVPACSLNARIENSTFPNSEMLALAPKIRRCYPTRWPVCCRHRTSQSARLRTMAGMGTLAVWRVSSICFRTADFPVPTLEPAAPDPIVAVRDTGCKRPLQRTPDVPIKLIELNSEGDTSGKPARLKSARKVIASSDRSAARTCLAKGVAKAEAPICFAPRNRLRMHRLPKAGVRAVNRSFDRRRQELET